jgi:integrase/recombinase XerC
MAVDQFLTYLQHEKRYSLHTVQSYQTDLVQFADFMQKVFELDIMAAGHVHVRDFLVSLMDEGMTESSVSRKLSALRSFFKYNLRQGTIPVSPMTLIKAPKIPKRIPVFIEDQKMDTLLDSGEFFDDSFASVRDKLVIEALFGTGMRLAELLALKESDVDFYAQCIRVMGKRNKERIIPVSKLLVDQIKAYLELKSFQNFNNKSRVLFVSNKGKDAYPDLIYKTVQRYLTYVSTQDKRSPHVLRHSYATSLLNRGADLNAIKELLGHASLAATQVYTHNSIERLKSIYKQAHPKA